MITVQFEEFETIKMMLMLLAQRAREWHHDDELTEDFVDEYVMEMTEREVLDMFNYVAKGCPVQWRHLYDKWSLVVPYVEYSDRGGVVYNEDEEFVEVE